ncbi:MAG: hypothetical protein ACRD0P_22655 [Stackebrandtia sp.]
MSTESPNPQQQQPVMVMAQPQAAPPTAGPQVPHQTPPSGSKPADTAPSAGKLKAIVDLRQRRLIGASIWALALGSCGFVIGAIALIQIMSDAPGWFEPTFGAVGVIGLGLIIAAFITVQRRVVPWVLLGASTALFIVGVVLLGSI